MSDLSCAEGQTIAIVDGVWVCADFPTGGAVTGLEWVTALSDLSGVGDPDHLDGATGLSYVSTQQAIALCPEGKGVVGGGYYHPLGGGVETPVIRDNLPSIYLNGWLASGSNLGADSWRLAAVAICANAVGLPPQPTPP